MSKFTSYYLFILLLIPCFEPLAIANSNNNSLDQLAVILEMENDKVSYTVASRRLDPSNLYNELGQIYGNNGRNTKIAIVMHDNVPFVWLRKLDAIIGKIGAKEIRYFYFDDYKRLIVEIRFFGSRAFTLDPKTLLEAE